MKALLFGLFYLLSSLVVAEEIEILSPKSGWRNSSSKKVKYLQEVQYPDVNISTPEDQPDNGLIEGRIKGEIKKHDKPYLMVVNGNAMPLEVNGGKFKRPYSFGVGPNSLKIISPDRKSSSSVQFYDVGKGGFPARIRISLSWDSDGTDLDLHVLTPEGKHCSYSNRVLKDGSALDVDVTTGYGPEIFSSPGSVKGPYLIYVNYYGRQGTEDITIATVNIVTNEGTLDEKVETVRVPMRRPGELTFIHSFNYY